jgi:signal transduction histidine kinase
MTARLADHQWRRFSASMAPTIAVVAAAVVLSIWVVLLVGDHDGGSAAAAAFAVLMTAPVAFALRWPVAVALVLAVAAGLNGVLFGHLVRCGATLPATFIVAFLVGYAADRRRRLGEAGVVASLVLQCAFDPRLGIGTVALMVPVAGLFYLGGRYARSRATMARSLREYSRELQVQQERIARLAVAADRDDLAGRLDVVLTEQVDRIATLTCSDQPPRARFAAIEVVGRRTLEMMRDLVGSLHDAPVRPEPGLADLAELCARTTTAPVTLTVDGEMRPLPASIELSACRIVEQLLGTLTDEPAGRVQLCVTFSVAGLDIAMTGTPTRDADVPRVEAVAHARATVHGGSVDITDRPGQRRATVWLPLISAYG